jgi:hypothetical protein
MNGIYVLIVIALSSHSATSFSQEFESEAACERVLEDIYDHSYGVAPHIDYIECVPKGDQ